MLKKRVIPIILLDGNYSVIKTIKFDVRRNLGNPVVVVKIYNTRDVDELIILDIDATKEDRKIDISTIEFLSSECFMPLSIGGGIRTCDDIEDLLKHGADRVILNTISIENRNIIKEAVSLFGSQCIVISVDIKKNDFEEYKIFSRQKIIDACLSDYIKEISDFGIGEIFLNSVDLDGTMLGPDLKLLKYISNITEVPIIMCGGISTEKDCVDVINSGAFSVSASSIFHFTSITPNECKKEMDKNGIPVRVKI